MLTFEDFTPTSYVCNLPQFDSYFIYNEYSTGKYVTWRCWNDEVNKNIKRIRQGGLKVSSREFAMEYFNSIYRILSEFFNGNAWENVEMEKKNGHT